MHYRSGFVQGLKAAASVVVATASVPAVAGADIHYADGITSAGILSVASAYSCTPCHGVGAWCPSPKASDYLADPSDYLAGFIIEGEGSGWPEEEPAKKRSDDRVTLMCHKEAYNRNYDLIATDVYGIEVRNGNTLWGDIEGAMEEETGCDIDPMDIFDQNKRNSRMFPRGTPESMQTTEATEDYLRYVVKRIIDTQRSSRIEF